jgi:hypothetical protein
MISVASSVVVRRPALTVGSPSAGRDGGEGERPGASFAGGIVW